MASSQQRVVYRCLPAVVKSLWTLYSMLFLAVSCSPGGDSGRVSPPPTTVPQLEQQAIRNLVELYRQAVLQEDIDLLETLFFRAGEATLVETTQSFLDMRSERFRTMSSTAFDIPEETMRIAADQRSMSFLEVDSVMDPTTLAQHTQLFRMAVQIVPREANGIVTLRMRVLQRSPAPLVQVSTPGRVQAGALTRVAVTGSEASFRLVDVQLVVPGASSEERLVRQGEGFYGVFTPPHVTAPQPLQLHLHESTGETMVLRHAYRLRHHAEGVVQRLAGTDRTRLLAVAAAADGTVWAGGEEGATLGEEGATLYVVPPGSDRAAIQHVFLSNVTDRVEDLGLDALGRLHILLLELDDQGLISQRVEVYDPRHDLLCPTVKVSKHTRDYPLVDLQGTPSASTRLVAVTEGDIWLLGSNGGVARVHDTFRDGRCSTGADTVRYDPVIRRAAGGLPANVVPTMATGPDGAIWFGSILGVSRWRDGQWTAGPFHPTLSLQGSVETLESFFDTLAEAIFQAQPIVAIARDGVSFVAEFGRAVVKEDLSWSMAIDHKGQVWVGTLGGGIRVIAVQDAQVRDVWHLTRTAIRQMHPEQTTQTVSTSEGLSSNIIFALAVAPDGAVWAATNKGVSRIQEQDEGLQIRNFTSLDGVSLPVNDLAIDPQGQVWLATDGSLARIVSVGGGLEGIVRNGEGNPVAGADVLVVGTAWRAVTDANGHFRITHLPPGVHLLQVDGALATAGPFGLAAQTVEVSRDGQTIIPPIHLLRRGERQLVQVAGAQQSGVVGTVLPQPLVVALRDDAGNGLPGVPLTFTLAAGNGRITPDQPVLTDSAGQAAVSLTLGTQAGENLVTVSGGGLSLVCSATGVPDRSSARLVAVDGNTQSVQVGERLPLPLVVRLEDQFRNPLVGIEVTASIHRGSGVLSTATSGNAVIQTDTDGRASFQLQTGADPQDILVEVAVTAPDVDLQHVPPVRFLTIVGTVDIAGLPWDLAVHGPVAYVVSGLAGLQVVDVSDIRHPQVRATITTLQADPTTVYRPSFLNITTLGMSAYAATFTPTTLTRFDITQPLQPVSDPPLVLDDLYQSSHPVKLMLAGNVAYLALANRAGGGSLHVFDLTNPMAPQVQGVLILPRTPRGLAVVDQFAYLPTAAAEVMVVNARDPQALKFAPAIADVLLHSMMTVGKTAYTIETRANEPHFSLFDLSLPGELRRLGSVPSHASAVPFTASAVALASPYAYVASFDRGLQVFDVQDLLHPTFVARVETPSVAFNAVTTHDATRTLVHVTDLAVGLHIVFGPPEDDQDTDGDGVRNFFDEFPQTPTETMDTDRDGQGNHADLDDDNDGVPDVIEQNPSLDPQYPPGVSPTDPLNPKDVLVSCRTPDDHTLHVDAAAATLSGDGSPTAPYRSIRTALQAALCLRARQVPGRITVSVRPGIYSALHTMEVFPLLLSDSAIDLIGAGQVVTPSGALPSCDAIPPAQPAQATIIDAAFFADVLDIVQGGATVQGLALQHGINGLVVGSENLSPQPLTTLRHLRVTDHLNTGIAVGRFPVRIEENYVAGNGFRGLDIEQTTAMVTGNTVHCHGEDGIFFFNARGNIAENRVANNTQDGIQIHAASMVQAVRANEIRANQARGLVVSTASTATVTDNVIADNVDTGVRVSFLADATLIANQILRNFVGVHVLESASAHIRQGRISSNHSDGILVTSPAGAVDIACTGGILTISSNGDDGIEVSDNTNVAVNRDNLRLQDNQGEEIQGNVSVCPRVP